MRLSPQAGTGALGIYKRKWSCRQPRVFINFDETVGAGKNLRLIRKCLGETEKHAQMGDQKEFQKLVTKYVVTTQLLAEYAVQIP